MYALFIILSSLILAQALEIKFVSPLKHSSTCSTFQCFFFSPFFLGWKWEGCRLPLQLQNQQERFQMPSGSHILASCHVLYDISIFTVLPEWERQKEKQRKTGAILAQQQWTAATCGSDSFRGVMGYILLHYNSKVYHFYGVTQQGEQCDRRLKQSQMALSISTQ